MVLEKKMQRNLAVEKRKVEQLTRVNQNLKITNKTLEEQIQDEKKKIKKMVRPVSSHPYGASHIKTNQSSMVSNDREKEKEHAIQLNDKLRKDLEQAKKKLV